MASRERKRRDRPPVAYAPGSHNAKIHRASEVSRDASARRAATSRLTPAVRRGRPRSANADLPPKRSLLRFDQERHLRLAFRYATRSRTCSRVSASSCPSGMIDSGESLTLATSSGDRTTFSLSVWIVTPGRRALGDDAGDDAFVFRPHHRHAEVAADFGARVDQVREQVVEVERLEPVRSGPMVPPWP